MKIKLTVFQVAIYVVLVCICFVGAFFLFYYDLYTGAFMLCILGFLLISLFINRIKPKKYSKNYERLIGIISFGMTSIFFLIPIFPPYPLYTLSPSVCVFLLILMLRSIEHIICKYNYKSFAVRVTIRFFVSVIMCFAGVIFSFYYSDYLSLLVLCILGLVLIINLIKHIRPREYNLVIRDYVLVSSSEVKKTIITEIKRILMGENRGVWCKILTEPKIPDTVISIGEKAFSSCKNLKSIEIPNSVVSIGEMAFSGCNNLAWIEIPNSVTSIGDHTFFGCDALILIETEGSYAHEYAIETQIAYDFK